MKFRPETATNYKTYFGTVTRFDKGYGFIAFDKDGREERAFVHWSNLLMAGYKKLEEGQTVEFEIEHNDKGYKAINVRVVG